MDEAVQAAIQRWPNVPAVYGWLSLNARGQWRLHPQGSWDDLNTGESIQNPQIVGFINRNYTCDAEGQWHFQNGPQRVYVRLERAPLVVCLTGQPMRLRTHNGLDVQQIHGWWIDAQDHLFLQTEHGPASIHDQDLEYITDLLVTHTGEDLLDWWQAQHNGRPETLIQGKPQGPLAGYRSMPLVVLDKSEAVQTLLGFVATPAPRSGN